MTRSISALLVFAFLFSGLSVFAEESLPTDRQGKNPTSAARKELNTSIKEKRVQLQNSLKQEKSKLQNTAKEKLELLKKSSATAAEKTAVKEELKAARDNLQEKAKTLRTNLKENAKELRDSFKEKVRSEKDRAKIAAAHGKGLKMLNRFRAAVARFAHILERLESRTEKIKARGVDVSSLTALIEEAKNMKVAADAKMEELKAKYESLLEGNNPQGIGEEARLIAKELKAEIEKLHGKLKEINSAIRALEPKSDEK